jgi:DNA-binding CsgD family transcriptional regulator
MSSKQRILTGLIIFCVLLAISFKADTTETTWLWSRWPFVAIFLILIAFLLVRVWLNLEQKRQEEKMLQIINNKNSIHSNQKILDLLSDREKEVLKKILEGKTNKQIADELHVALSTIKTHINNIYKVLNVSNRDDLRKITNLS